MHEKLLDDKNRQIKDEEREKHNCIEENYDKFEQEATSLLEEIKTFNPEDEWQYQKGLRLSYLGTILNNKFYKKKGLEFLRKDWNK